MLLTKNYKSSAKMTKTKYGSPVFTTEIFIFDEINATLQHSLIIKRRYIFFNKGMLFVNKGMLFANKGMYL